MNKEKSKIIQNKMKSNSKDNPRGITLIALVITVVVMLILAGVAISVLVNGDGLFTKTRAAAEEYKSAAEEEASTVSDWVAKIDEYLSDNPTITFETDPISTEYGKEVTIKIIAKDENNGIAKIQLPDKTEKTYSNETEIIEEYKVIENGTYSFTVQSGNGNPITKNIVIENVDNEAPSIPTVEWRYKVFEVTKRNVLNGIEFVGTTENNSNLYRTTSEQSEIELNYLENIDGVYKILFNLKNLNDSINYKLICSYDDEYTNTEVFEGTLVKDGGLHQVDVKLGDYKKIKIQLGDKSGLEFETGTIDIVAASNSSHNAHIRNVLNSIDNGKILKYQKSEDKISWIDCSKEYTITNEWNKKYYYRAIDTAGNISEATEECVINCDRELPTATLTSSNVTANSFTLNATGTDAKSGVFKYEFYINDVLEEYIYTTEENATFTASEKVSLTKYNCKVRVYDAAGNYTESSVIEVTTL